MSGMLFIVNTNWYYQSSRPSINDELTPVTSHGSLGGRRSVTGAPSGGIWKGSPPSIHNHLLLHRIQQEEELISPTYDQLTLRSTKVRPKGEGDSTTMASIQNPKIYKGTFLSRSDLNPTTAHCVASASNGGSVSILSGLWGPRNCLSQYCRQLDGKHVTLVRANHRALIS